MSLGDKIRQGALWQFAGNLSSQALTFAFGIVLARLLAPEDFGMLVTIQMFTGLAGFLAGGGMGQGLVRAKEANEQDYACVLTLQLLIGGAIYAAFFAVAPWFAIWYEQPLYANLLRVSALSFLTRPFVNLPATLLIRAMRFKALNLVKITTLLTSSSVSIVLAWHGHGVWSLVLGGLAGSLCSMLMLAQLSQWRPAFTWQLRRAGGLARYGMLVSANDIVTYLRTQAANFILGRTLGAAAVGLFNKVDSLAKMPHQLVTSSVYQVLFRALAQEQGNLDKSRYLFFRSVSLVAVYATPLYLGVSWLAEPLIATLYGPKWLESAAPLATLVLAGPFAAIGTLSGAVLAARAWLRKELVVQLIFMVVTALATLAGLGYGLQGVALALLLVAICNALQMYALAARCLQARWGQLATALGPAVGLNAILYCLLFTLDRYLAHVDAGDLAKLAVMIAAGGGVYAACFLYLPIKRLASEQLRWKRKLRLAPDPALKNET